MKKTYYSCAMKLSDACMPTIRCKTQTVTSSQINPSLFNNGGFFLLKTISSNILPRFVSLVSYFHRE